MATAKQKEAARRNLEKARQAQSARARGKRVPRDAEGLSTAQEERKEPLTGASHVRNAIARFDQVEGVTDAERDRAWKRICKAADKFGVEVSARDWRELF